MPYTLHLQPRQLPGRPKLKAFAVLQESTLDAIKRSAREYISNSRAEAHFTIQNDAGEKRYAQFSRDAQTGQILGRIKWSTQFFKV